MCFIIGCECDEIRKVTIVFFFFSLRHHHRRGRFSAVDFPPPTFFFAFFFVHTGFRVCVCVCLSDTHKKKAGKREEKENKVEKRLI